MKEHVHENYYHLAVVNPVKATEQTKGIEQKQTTAFHRLCVMIPTVQILTMYTINYKESEKDNSKQVIFLALTTHVYHCNLTSTDLSEAHIAKPLLRIVCLT